MKTASGELTWKSDKAQSDNDILHKKVIELLPHLGPNWHIHSVIGLKVQALSRIIYYTELYKKIVEVPGVILEFGVQWGATMCALTNLRSVFEPFNHSRTIVGFDTFSGFPSVSSNDGENWRPGDFSSKNGFVDELGALLELHEASAPMSHLKKFELVRGDISDTFPHWLADNRHAIVSMAIFDTDLYQPTLDVLRHIKPRLTKGSLLVFDELSCRYFPGETIALREALGTENLKLRRTPLQPFCSWAVWGD